MLMQVSSLVNQIVRLITLNSGASTLFVQDVLSPGGGAQGTQSEPDSPRLFATPAPGQRPSGGGQSTCHEGRFWSHPAGRLTGARLVPPLHLLPALPSPYLEVVPLTGRSDWHIHQLFTDIPPLRLIFSA